MLTPAYTKQFERDIKRMKKRGKNLEKMKIIIRSIAAEEPLDDIHRDHRPDRKLEGSTGMPH